ncbi:MAG: hypothetical protein U1F36_20885 [Planctomycetota bacterium]
MRTTIALLGCLAAPLAAQGLSMPASLSPDGADLNTATPAPFGVRAARVQQFYEVAETGQSAFMATAIALRPDGPSIACAGSGTITLGALSIRVGTTTHGVDVLGADLDANLSTPLTTAFQGQSISLPCDLVSGNGPEPWGGVGGALRFPLSTPVAIAVPQGGCLAVELRVDGNLGGEAAHVALDFDFDASGILAFGDSVNNGNGCAAAAGAGGLTLATVGQYEPGTAFRLIGSNYPPNAPVATLVTAQLLQNHLALPLTSPTCWLYVDPDTGPVLAGASSNNNGEIGGDNLGPVLPLPKTPAMCGAVLYVQNAAPTPTFAGNQLGVVTSNYRTVHVGCTQPSAVRGWHAANLDSSTARFATAAAPGGLAMRIE